MGSRLTSPGGDLCHREARRGYHRPYQPRCWSSGQPRRGSPGNPPLGCGSLRTVRHTGTTGSAHHLLPPDRPAGTPSRRRTAITCALGEALVTLGLWTSKAGDVAFPLPKAHRRRCCARALTVTYQEYASLGPGTHPTRMGDAALHLDLFEQPERKRVFQQPASPDRRRFAGRIVGVGARLDNRTGSE